MATSQSQSESSASKPIEKIPHLLDAPLDEFKENCDVKLHDLCSKLVQIRDKLTELNKNKPSLKEGNEVISIQQQLHDLETKHKKNGIWVRE